MKTTIIVIVLIAVIAIFFVNTYTSSPGFTTPEMAQEFEATKKTCYGLDIPLNKEAVAADAPGKNVCIGVLK